MKYKNSGHFFWHQIGQKLKGVKNNKKLIIIIISVLVLFVFVSLSFGLLAYNKPMNSKFVNAVIRIVPYPAAIVDGKIIKLYDWQFEYAAWKKASDDSQTGVIDSQVKEDVLNKMIYDSIILKLAKKYKVTLNQADIDKEILTLADEQFEGSLDKLTEEIKNTFGWTLNDFEQRLIAPALYTQKLTETFASNEEAWQKALDEIHLIQADIDKAINFDVLAESRSDDTGSAVNGGELGWFGRGEMVPEFEEAAFSLEPGQISQPVRTEYGYHLILVEEVKKVEKDGVEVVDQVKARHILIRPESFEEVLKQTVDSVKVWHLIKF
ncbi:hypothetical protein A2533_03785 [Candidatus Falkowbacteria bacterium RIFOXYD2_FULL_35_9]|uniref:PpiC domain-containing protein n=1 Tax=Candidatus Falkowbacteria bacterium RIFOXYC2_FULL_36_12 TaxID=1798002 RepID=A0A1F5T1A4_9BACT|nr:MAG: hypothetical protein A2300_00595 [Candidatus Falkowbacteria bacterium RIFOXYB2_FULL_35_7]OGF32513.1 MAG: hypothetical protein A2478_02680 [Candidatus Falkowbacteria bacterium RIFOXYC2_FULL_36_12]OGF45975.1 MAG: hypothetical protein A2533_03785 [Candidatus Falkowbacteria bacterium RIFOXYD2_FULL_35_9]